MAVVLPIAFAHLKNRKRQTLVSVLGVALGVGFFIAIAALMQGFQQYFVHQIIDISPHIVIKDEYRMPPAQAAELAYPDGAVAIAGVKPKDELRGIKGARAKMAMLREMPGILAAPTLRGSVLLRYGSRDVAVSLVGIEPAAERRVTRMEADLTVGRLDDLFTEANAIILGDGLAQKLGAAPGDTIIAASPAGFVLKMKVVGLVHSGLTVLDNGEAYALLKKAQILQDRANVINQIQMRVSDVEGAERIAAEIEARFGYRTESWQESNRNVLGIFVVQNGIMYSTTSAILIVAAFGIYNIISTVVFEKTRDIAILKSMGFTERDIGLVFLTEGLIVGLLGAVIGWGVGYGLSEVLASIRFHVEGIVTMQSFQIFFSGVHYLIGAGFAIAAAAVAAVLPARKAASLNPVDIVRGAA